MCLIDCCLMTTISILNCLYWLTRKVCYCFFVYFIFIICPPCKCMWNACRRLKLSNALGFVGGYFIGHLYYAYFFKALPFPFVIRCMLSLGISLLLGVGNAVCRQLRCITLLFFPMFGGKPGRGVLKAVVLTYVIAGPITNMGLNAKEVVRVFACSTHLTHNLSIAKYALMAAPFKKAAFGLRNDIENVKDSLRSFRDVAAPIEKELVDTAEVPISRELNNFLDDMFAEGLRSNAIDHKHKIKPDDTEEDVFQKMYLKKLEFRCQTQLSRAVALCIETFDESYNICKQGVPKMAAWAVCWPLRITYVCNLLHVVGGADICDSSHQEDPGLSKGYLYLQKAKMELTNDFNNVKLQYKVPVTQELTDIQDAKETGARVMHAFEEKHIIMQQGIVVVNVCVSLLFLRIILTAATYHDLYLTGIGYDNVYVTGYFKKLDKKRKRRGEHTLLPLKKMERSKYIDLMSMAYTAERSHIVTQILKVMLEMVTATTFVMLDRLFYEALDVVRQHAEVEVNQQGDHELWIKVEGNGMLANLVRSILLGLSSRHRVRRSLSNAPCLPQPRSMPSSFYGKIYGGYFGIVVLLYLNPYTMRLRRLICSWFYPRREKQRILHLYNDILKKRLKMKKTLQRKAVQAIRAYYLAAENLLSLRIKFPQLLGWLSVFPAARKTCLICRETEPRNSSEKAWRPCPTVNCPFVYCGECWREVEHCLACDPALAELSDDSLSEDEQLNY